MPQAISWADEERDLTAWLGNDLQDAAFNKLYSLSSKVNRSTDVELKKDWDYLQVSDHFYYMCTKFFSDGAVHAYFNPYESPYDAFMNYMNVLSDFEIRLNREFPDEDQDRILNKLSKDIVIQKIALEKKETEIRKLRTRVKNLTSGTDLKKNPVKKKTISNTDGSTRSVKSKKK